MMETSKEQARLRVRPLRHLRLVPRSRSPGQRQCPLPAGPDPDLERLCRPPRLRRFLDAADPRSLIRQSPGADAERGRLVGPGGFLRSAPDLRSPGRARYRQTSTSWLSGLGIMAAGTGATGAASAPYPSTARPRHFRDEIQAPWFAFFSRIGGNCRPPRRRPSRPGRTFGAPGRSGRRYPARPKSASSSTRGESWLLSDLRPGRDDASTATSPTPTIPFPTATGRSRPPISP